MISLFSSISFFKNHFLTNGYYSMQGYIPVPLCLQEDDKLGNRLENSQEERASVIVGLKVIPQQKGFIPSPSPLSFVLVTSNERVWREKGGNDVRDGWRDGWRGSWLSACMCLGIYYYPVERGALMDEEHPLPFQQWKCLKHPGPRDGPCHSPPSWWLMDLPDKHPRAAAVGLSMGGWDAIVHVMTEARPP